MRKAIIFLVCCMTLVAAQAQRVTRNYRDVSIADALRQLAEESRDYTIYFLYNELEDFTITTHIKNKPVPEAIRQMIGFYPIRMTQGSSPTTTARSSPASPTSATNPPIACASVTTWAP